MPIRQLDRAAIRREARELIRTARVSPIKFTLLFLAVSLALSLLDTALTSLTGRIVGVAFVSVSFASILIGLITQVLDAGYRTGDIWSEGCTKVGCTQMGDLVAARI